MLYVATLKRSRGLAWILLAATCSCGGTTTSAGDAAIADHPEDVRDASGLDHASAMETGDAVSEPVDGSTFCLGCTNGCGDAGIWCRPDEACESTGSQPSGPQGCCPRDSGLIGGGSCRH